MLNDFFIKEIIIENFVRFLFREKKRTKETRSAFKFLYTYLSSLI